jgi:hypothetical protein
MGALREEEKAILHKAYFLKKEIADFDNARSIDGTLQDLNFTADNFQMMIRNRINLVERLKVRGWSRQKVGALIASYYSEKHRSKRAAWDFLQVEASPSSKQRNETDNSIARRLLKLSRIQATLGASYTRGVSPTTRPLNIPRRPDY